MRLELQPAQRHHQAVFRKSSARAARRCRRRIASQRSAIVWSNSASSITGRRRAQSRRKGDRSKMAARKSRTSPAPERSPASRGSLRRAAARRSRQSRPPPHRVERRQGEAQLQSSPVSADFGFRPAIYPPLACGKAMTTAKPGSAWDQVETAAVELHDRLGETQPETGARLRAALLEPHETFRGALPVFFVGNAGAIVGDAEPDLAVGLLDAIREPSACRQHPRNI